MTFDVHELAVWNYTATITNDACCSGNHVYSVEPGRGNIAILIAGRFLNGDTAGRTGTIDVRNVDNSAMYRLVSATFAAGAFRTFPTTEVSADNGFAGANQPYVLAGLMDLNANLAAIAVSQDTAFSISMLIHGEPPTVTLTSPGGATENVTEDATY